MPRKFKPGDWVKLKGKTISQKMEILKYTTVRDPIFRIKKHDSYVECVWYVNGERKSEIYHQNKLIKLIETGGLYRV